MSLGLADFGSRGRSEQGSQAFRVVRLAGFLALAYVLGVAILEGVEAFSAARALEEAGAGVARSSQSLEDARRALRKNADILTATASVESSPERVLTDLKALLPEGVSVPALRIEYTAEALTRVEITVVARTPDAYDRFLNTLSKSERFSEIKPGAEMRPGLVRATLTAIHRAKALSR